MRYVESWIEQGIVAQWPDLKQGDDQKIVVIENGAIKSESKSHDRFVAVPKMNSICKHLATGLDIRTQTRIAKVNTADSAVEIFDETNQSLGKFGRLIVSTPAAQAAELLVNFPALAEPISKVEMKPCWATMVGLEKPITDQWAGAFLYESFLSWACLLYTSPSPRD